MLKNCHIKVKICPKLNEPIQNLSTLLFYCCLQIPGTGPNIVFIGFIQDLEGQPLTFGTW